MSTGPQETEVQALIGGSDDQRQLVVRMGGVTVHVGDGEALSSFVDAWRQASELGELAFGSRVGSPSPGQNRALGTARRD